ncbi:MAG TPA: transcriptional repressor LexA [Acidimicrobiia bacterium]
MDSLTPRQREILDYITDIVVARGYPPSVREIGDRVGLKSPSTVHSHLSTLVRSGYLRRDPFKPRAIEIVDRPMAVLDDERTIRHVPLVGRIAAGVPILAEQDIEAVYALPTDITGSGPVFMLEVRGDSMKDAGILHGDLVVVRSQSDADDGDVVAALIAEEEATVKRLRRSAGRVTLVAENPDYEPIAVEGDMRILGKVVAVLRTL